MLYLKNMPAYEFLDKFFKLDNLSFDTIYDDKVYSYNVASYNNKEKDGNITVLNLSLLEKRDEDSNWVTKLLRYIYI